MRKRKLLKEHNKITMKLIYEISGKGNHDVIALGEEIGPMLDSMFNGGGWILKGDKEYYSPNFRRALGFLGEGDFPSVPSSWKKAIRDKDARRALRALEAHKKDPSKPYYLDVTYRKKRGGKVHLICAGAIVNQDDPNEPIMLGTHEIVNNGLDVSRVWRRAISGIAGLLFGYPG
jgi:hypothetical protein